MVVIAIIIILAAIAIPNYLSMTQRAKKSRVASDFAAIATALETYKTDWNTYPIFAKGGIIGQGTNPTTLGLLGNELSGSTTASYKNKTPNVTAAGDTAPIQYMTGTIVESMINPYSTAAGDEYQYSGVTGSTTSHWCLSAVTVTTTPDSKLLWRTDEQTAVQDNGTNLTAVAPTD